MQFNSIFISTLIILSSLIYSQSPQYIDVINLKNGDLIKGRIVENVINDYIKVDITGGSSITVHYNDISSITVENISQQIFFDTPTQNQTTESSSSMNPYDCYLAGLTAGKQIDTSNEKNSGCVMSGLLGVIGWGISYTMASNGISEPPANLMVNMDSRCKIEFRRGWEKSAKEARIKATNNGSCMGISFLVALSAILILDVGN